MNLELYIQGIRVDLFTDEGITLSRSVKDVRDIAKVFSSYTHPFTIPSSRVNNKLMKHFYKVGAQGLDLRLKIDAEIRLGGFPYKNGKVSIVGSTIEMGLVQDYNIIFYANTVVMTDVLKEDMIKDLPLSKFDHEFSEGKVHEGLTGSITGTGIAAGDIIYQLISRKHRYFYDSTGTVGSGNDKNVCYKPGTTQGVIFTDLKPSLKILRIIEAIKVKYPLLKFSNDFFDSSNILLDSIYMWLQRSGGVIGEDSTGHEEKVKVADPLTHTSGANVADVTTNTGQLAVTVYKNGYLGTDRIAIDLKVTPTGAKKYNVKVYDWWNSVIIHEQKDITGVWNMPQFVINGGDVVKYSNLILTVTTTDGLSVYEAEYTVNKVAVVGGGTGTYKALAQTFDSTVVIANEMPKMKVIDFLRGLFKMFNLIAVVKNDGTIYIDTYDKYYAAGKDIAIDKYVDIKKVNINTASVFSEIMFENAKPKMFLAINSNNINGRITGDLKYVTGFDGAKYSVKTPFEYNVPEHLFNHDGGTTHVTYTYYVDESEKPTVGAPLLTFNKAQSGRPLSYKEGASYVSLQSGNTNLPISKAPNGNTLSFDEIIGVQTGEYLDRSLFYMWYRHYIQNVMNFNQRLTTLTAIFPINIMLTLNLNDKLIWKGQKYIINDMKIDFLKKTTNLTLLKCLNC